MAALDDGPVTVALAEALASLGELARGIEAVPEPSVDDVPEWLFQVLVNVVGMPRDQAGLLDAEQAEAVWQGFLTAPRPEP